MAHPVYSHSNASTGRSKIILRLDHPVYFAAARPFQSLISTAVSFIIPPPVGERGIVFERFLSLFIYFFVSLSATLRENGWTDLHEILRAGVE